MAAAEFQCRVCGLATLEELPEYSELPRVTSDCKPFAAGGRLMVCRSCGAAQNPADDKWLSEIDGIYRSYEPYYQSGGVEQAVFDATQGKPRLRSSVILDRLAEVRNLGDTGSAIDVGCGNGVLLKAFANVRPGWELYGHELNRLHEAELKRIPGFQQLFTTPLAELPRQFDLITMMHALEHFPDPLAGISDLKARLADGGSLFIEVPNGAATPFDLMIADHASHFTLHDLARLFKRAGMGAPSISDSWVTKELSAVATANGLIVELPAEASPSESLARVKAQLAWLRAVLDGARAAAGEKTKFGIFGSSVAAMWLYGALGDEIEFFVDEDPNRRNAMLHGRPILAPEDVPDGSVVYLTLIPQVASAVANRLGRPGVEFRAPPAVGG
jgi:2-polyprenyl-3-methyl-5-hydroxy-6-metoxy-1,4-benzoquinol methylase